MEIELDANNVMPYLLTERIKETLFKEFNSFLDIIEQDDPFWNKLFQKYEKKIEYLFNKLQVKEFVKTSPNILDHIYRHLNGELSATVFLTHLNSTISILTPNIPNKLKEAYKNIVKDLLQNFDKTDNRCLNHFGEILFLKFIIVSNSYKLKNIELEQKNGRSFDFLLESSNNNEVLVEILNIHIFENSIHDETELQLLLTEKISKKIKDKLRGLQEGDIEIEFSFVIIVWTEDSLLRKYQHIFNKFGGNQILIEPLCFQFFQKANDPDFEFYFGPISKLQFN